MFDFLKKIFGWPTCTDCQNGETDASLDNTPTFPITEPTVDTTKTETVPEVMEQPSLSMSMPTVNNPTVDTPAVEEPIAPIDDIPVETEVTPEVVEPTTEIPTEETTPTV